LWGQGSVVADSAHHVLVNLMGYNAEPFDGEGGYDIYIMSYSTGSYGYTFLQDDGISYIQIDNDYLGYDIDPLVIMALSLGHEYFHAIQIGYKPNLYDTYFFEMSSMWFEDVLVPDGNDYLNWIDPLFSNPSATFGTTGAGYELGLFGHYLSSFLDQKGIEDAKNSHIIRIFWEYFGETNSSALSTLQDVLSTEYEKSFIEAWTDFMSRNLFNGISDNFYYYIDQGLINPITTNPQILANSESFTLQLDDKSATIQSFSNTTLDILLSIGHSSNDYLGRVAILSPNNTNLFWATDTSNIELEDDSEIHFLYGSPNMDSVSINLLSTPDNNNYDATEASIFVYPNEVKLFANGYIGGVEMTVIHDNDFSIDMTQAALLADYATEGNETHLIVVIPQTNLLFTYTGYIEITDWIVANSQDEVPTEIYYYNYNIGDVNGDGGLNILDVVALVDIIMSNGDYIELGDINNDGYLNIMDVVQLINLILL